MLPLFPQKPKSITEDISDKLVSKNVVSPAAQLKSETKQILKQSSKLDKSSAPEPPAKKDEKPHYLLKKISSAQTSKPRDVEQPIYTLPKKPVDVSSFDKSKIKVDDTPDYSLPKQKLSPQVIPKTDSIYKLKDKLDKPVDKCDNFEKPAKPEKPKFEQIKNEPPVLKKKVEFAKTAESSFKKKKTPPVVNNKPSTLTAAKQREYEIFKEKFEERNPIKPKDEEKNLKLAKEAPIISGKPSTASLKKFQATSEHNTHNQVSYEVNGRVPLPGMTSKSTVSSTMAPRPAGIPKSQSSYTIGSTLNSHSPSPPKGSFLASRPQPSFMTSQMLDMPPKPHASPPPGSFLASRSSSPISITHSPTRGGFIQSAMLRNEGINRTRAGSTDSLHSINSFSEISLVNPISRSSSRTPSPIRVHGRTKSTTSIDNSADAKKNFINDKNDRFNKSINFGSVDLSKPRPVGHFCDDSNIKEDDSAIRRDSRRWSPSRPSWLENAINKSPSMSGIDSINKSATHLSGTKTASVSFKPVAPAKPPPPRKPTAIALSEPSLPDDEDESTNDLNFSSVSSSIGRPATLKPSPVSIDSKPFQPRISSKPVPPGIGSKPSADAIEKLRLLRAGTTSKSMPESPAKTPPTEEEEKEESTSSLPIRPKSTPLPFEVKPRLRPPISRGIKPQPRTPFPAVPPSLVPKSRPVNAEIPAEPLIMKYHPTEEEDSSLDNASIPTVLSKKTAHSFASDLSAVLKRGKPLVPLEDTNTSFSPRFERFAEFSGPKKSHTFEDTLSSNSGNKTLQSKQKQLTHMTKSRAKGPKRRLPKATTLPVNASLKIHTRQRSRSLSPKPSQKNSISSSSAKITRFSVNAFKPTNEQSSSFKAASSPFTHPANSVSIRLKVNSFKPPGDPVSLTNLTASAFKPPADPTFLSSVGKLNGVRAPANPVDSSELLSSIPSTDPMPSALPKVKTSKTDTDGRVKPLIRTPSRAVSLKSKALKPIPVPPKPKGLSVSVDSE